MPRPSLQRCGQRQRRLRVALTRGLFRVLEYEFVMSDRRRVRIELRGQFFEGWHRPSGPVWAEVENRLDSSVSDDERIVAIETAFVRENTFYALACMLAGDERDAITLPMGKAPPLQNLVSMRHSSPYRTAFSGQLKR